jgi:tetratricopeptide (TPR) repeat protein
MRIQTAFPIIPTWRQCQRKQIQGRTLFYSESNYCDNNKTEDQAIQTYNLGKIYYDLNRYTDARESFETLFQSLTPTVQSANTYYYLSLPIVKKNTKLEISLNKSIYL